MTKIGLPSARAHIVFPRPDLISPGRLYHLSLNLNLGWMQTFNHNTMSGSREVKWNGKKATSNKNIFHRFSRFFSALCHPTRAVGRALLGGHAYRLLIGACNPML